METKQGRRIVVQRIPVKIENNEIEDLIATVCYFYPQYTFKQASLLPLKRIDQLLKVARQQQAIKYANLTQIIAAPHFEKGKNVKKLIQQFKEIARNG